MPSLADPITPGQRLYVQLEEYLYSEMSWECSQLVNRQQCMSIHRDVLTGSAPFPAKLEGILCPRTNPFCPSKGVPGLVPFPTLINSSSSSSPDKDGEDPSDPSGWSLSFGEGGTERF